MHNNMNKEYTISNGQLKVTEDIITKKETVFEVVAIQKRIDEIDAQIENLQAEKNDLLPLIVAINENKKNVTVPDVINNVEEFIKIK
jgi:seryl-tRNA synthetase